MKKSLMEDFQDTVLKFHIWNKSVLDILTKLSISTSKVERATIKSVTGCGCVEIEGKKSVIEFGKDEKGSQLRGVLCSDCKNSVEREIGENFYYLVTLCNALNLNAEKIIRKEMERVKTLGKYNLM